MRYIPFLLTLVLLSALLWLLNSPQKAGDKALPPIGSFFNPFSGFWRNAEPLTGPGLADKINLPGLSGPVEVVYDDLLAPHVFAANLEDAVMVQGYVTAQHRLWQMDILTRRISGRLSEVLGQRTVSSDRMMRRRGMVFAAENELKKWQSDPAKMKIFEAFAAGVNAWVAQLRPAEYPIEFKLLNYKPEPWTPLKTALVLKSMAENLCSREDDLASTLTLQAFGRDTFDFLFPEWNPAQRPIVTDQGQWKSVATPKLAPSPVSYGRDSALSYVPDRQLPVGMRGLLGSNNWAVGPSRAAEGSPLLSNDMHLTLTLPAIWYQIQLHTPQQSTYGVSLPGAPGIIVGFNNNVAWGITNVSHDVSDWYRIAWTDASRTTYLLDGQPRQAEMRVETIGIQGQTPLLDTVRYTVWGPVTHHDPKHPLYDCALRWIAHDVPDKNIADFLQLNEAANYTDYQKALSAYASPAQNIAFASRQGDIAIQAQGKYPLRAKEQGRFVQDGSQSAHGWNGFIPQEYLPNQHNPAQGFVFSANQHSTSPGYPFYYLGGFDDTRGRRIHSRLDAMQKATVDSMKSMQLDNHSLMAADALPVLLRLLNREGLDPVAQTRLAELEKWDYRYEKDAIAPTLFSMWFDSTYHHTWDEMEALRQRKINVLLPETWRFIDLLKKDTANVFFDDRRTPQRETARLLVRRAFDEMVKNSAVEAAKNNLAWGQFRDFTIRHLGQIEPFGRKDVVVGGHGSAPNAISAAHGPSWRMIVQLKDTIKAVGVYPGGQSGNPGSRFYDNMVDAWAKGEYYDLLLLDKPEDAPAARVYRRQVFRP